MSNIEWPMPELPKKYPVHSIPIQKNQTFISQDEGIFLDKDSARNLLINLDELDVYIAKQQKLIDAMKKYYNAK